MDTNLIESMIDSLGSSLHDDPQLLELLAAVADRNGAESPPESLDRAAQFVTAYIRQVPYMVKVARTAARAVGLEKEMDCILDIVESYWKEGNDVIPDDMGVIGLMDDAYCSLSLLQSVSDNYRLLTGKYLFPDDLSAANEAMQKIIGEPYISELDSLVVHTMKEACLIDSVKQLADDEKRLALDSDATIWNHGPVGRVDLSDLEELGLL
jgi:uncharacterized membrane protein YkvA (DUF1232 family)